MAPMTRARVGEDGVPKALNALYYAQRASAGLIITESTQVCAEGASFPYNPGIYSPDQVVGWRLVTDAVHAAGGRIIQQLWHAGRAAHPSMLSDGRWPVGPSAIAAGGPAITRNGWQPHVVPRAMQKEDIAEAMAHFASAAANALAAGFDGVEIHAANGFLIDQFMRDGSNQRQDEYGGAPANRVRFLREVVQAVATVWPLSRIGVRFSPDASMLGMSDSDPKALFEAATAAINELGIAYLHIIEPHGPDLDRVSGLLTAAFFRERFGGRVIANSSYTRERAEQVLGSGAADCVSFGRPFIANPDLPERLRGNAPLAPVDPETVYGGGEQGYTDYPLLADCEKTLNNAPAEAAQISLKLNLDRIFGRENAAD